MAVVHRCCCRSLCGESAGNQRGAPGLAYVKRYIEASALVLVLGSLSDIVHMIQSTSVAHEQESKREIRNTALTVLSVGQRPGLPVAWRALNLGPAILLPRLLRPL